MAAAPRVVFQAASALEAERAREVLVEVGIVPVPVAEDPLWIGVTDDDYPTAATLLDAAFPPSGPAPEVSLPASLTEDDSDDAPAPEPPAREPRPGRRRLPAGFKVGTIAVCSAFLPWLGSAFAGFALLAALWLLARRRTPGRWVALALALAASGWQAFLLTRLGG
ncbi:MAG: hypothetical protein R3F62_10930 [Planctomycetota bacterium]